MRDLVNTKIEEIVAVRMKTYNSTFVSFFHIVQHITHLYIVQTGVIFW